MDDTPDDTLDLVSRMYPSPADWKKMEENPDEKGRNAYYDIKNFIDDEKGITLVSASTLEKELKITNEYSYFYDV